MKLFIPISNRLARWKLEDRLERKYTLPTTDFESLEPFILESGFIESYQPRTVHSVYFDSPSKTSYQDASEGNSKRFKVRWRWYDQNGTISPSQLELKIKSADVITKYVISNKNISDIKNEVKAQNFPKPCNQIFSSWQPVLKNSYLRAYYQHAYWPIRVTLDKNLTPNMERFKSSNPGFNTTYILEIKYPVEAEQFLQKLTIFKTLPLQRQRFSKFIEGINSKSI